MKNDGAVLLRGLATLLTVLLTVMMALLLVAASAGDGMSETTPIIVDFSEEQGPAWRSIDDVVMGGVSRSRLQRTPQGTALFEGELSLERNGGFASVRAALAPTDLSAWTGLEIRVRGEGQRYRLRLRDDGRFDGVAYQVPFETTEGEWQELRLPFANFLPTFRGRVLSDVEALATDRIQQIGLMIADKQAGPFRLEIAWIRAYGARENPADD